MDSDTTSSTMPFSSDTDTSSSSSELEPSSSPFSSSQELDDMALDKTPTMPVVIRHTEYDRTPTARKYRPPSKEHTEKSSRRLFIIPPIGDDTSPPSSPFEEPTDYTRPLIHLQREELVLRHSSCQLDWTRQLPMKVLQRIFAFYICFVQASLHPVNKPYIVPCAKSGPLLLSQICKYWRDTAFASPSLWGSLSVGSNQPDIALLKHWLCRSRHTPLSLRFGLNLNPSNKEYIGAILDLFALHHERWQILDFRLDDVLANKLCAILGLIDAESSIGQLQRVRLDTKLCSVPIISKTLFTLERFPNLQEIIYANSDRKSFLSNAICGSPLWSLLTCIDIGATLSQFECIFFLSQCTSATSITFQNIYDFNDGEEEPPLYIFLQHLQHFDITTSTVDVCSTILTHLTCPSLNTLSIVTTSNASETPAHLGDFLTRSACPLRFLNIFDWTMDIHTLFPFIRAITTSGAGVGSRKRIKTLGIYSTEMPRKRQKFYEALRDEEKSNGSLGVKIDRIDYWGLFNPDGLRFRTRIGWGKRPAYL